MSETLLLRGFLTAGLWTLEATLLLLAAWCLVRYAAKSASMRHLIWLTAFCGMLVIPCLSAVLPPLLVVRTSTTALLRPFLPQSGTRSLTAAGPRTLEPRSSDALPVQSLSDSTEAAKKPVSLHRYGHLVRQALLCLWAGGVAVVGLSDIAALYGLFLWRRRSIDATFAPEELEELARRVGLRRKWALRASAGSRPAGAMTWGILHPIVLLPKEATSWPPDRLEAVLLHELAHVRRNDCGSQLLARLVCALYWFHPAVWFAARAMRAEAETAADDAVILTGIKPSAYATQLLWFAAHLGKHRQAVFNGMGVSLMKESKIETRIQAIVAPVHPRSVLTSADMIKVGSTGLIAVMLLAAVRPAVSSDHGRQAPSATLKPTITLATLHQVVRPLTAMAVALKPPQATHKTRTRRRTVRVHRSRVNPDVLVRPKSGQHPAPKADAQPQPRSADVWVKPHSANWSKPDSKDWVKPHSADWTKPHPKDWVKPHPESWTKPHSPDVRPTNSSDTPSTTSDILTKSADLITNS